MSHTVIAILPKKPYILSKEPCIIVTIKIKLVCPKNKLLILCKEPHFLSNEPYKLQKKTHIPVIIKTASACPKTELYIFKRALQPLKRAVYYSHHRNHFRLSQKCQSVPKMYSVFSHESPIFCQKSRVSP